MERLSRETTPSKSDLDFIVDDGYNHDVDPDYIPSESEMSEMSETMDESESEMSETMDESESESDIEKDVSLDELTPEFFKNLDNVVKYYSKFIPNRSKEYKEEFKEKMKSGYFTNVISIIPESVEANLYEDYIDLVFVNYLGPDKDGDIYETGGDYVHLFLPLPLSFDDEWFEKYRKANLNIRTIEDCSSEGYVKEI